ncbi:hypothetical protein [Lishizhenia sp.]|uniref:toxin-antitoxin system YwqK family antitoxin n=1 Tax=Lishizhenia sp. TaxID=2497594 RepID=UPI00299DE72B|nr:hypothetical protein [Lishizhenia sp.]MDX1445473.1 hypothetical protein [Lishizhenia sp.]
MLLLISASAFSSEPEYNKPQFLLEDTINQFDNAGKKHGYWVIYGKDVDSSLHFPTNGKVREGNFEHGRKEGVWTFYYKDGKTPKLKGYYSNNRPEGSFTKYWPNGLVKEEGVFRNQKYQDSLKRYNDKGVLVYQASFDSSGNESGEIAYYYDDGNPQFVYTAKKGKPVGEAKRFYPNGDVKEVINYNENGALISSEKKEMISPEKQSTTPNKSKKAPTIEDKSKLLLNGYNKVYNDNHELWQDGEFKEGQLWDGKVYVYDEDGLLLKVEVYKEGRYHSEGQL